MKIWGNFEKSQNIVWWDHEEYLKRFLGKLEKICQILKKI